MNYTQLKQLILDYADRQDAEVVDNIDNFLLVTESRINRDLKIANMTTRTRLLTIADQEYYGLPNDFAGLRDIEITNDNSRETLDYLSPEQMNSYASSASSDTSNNVNNKIYYTIIAQQLQIYPPQEDLILELVYYQQLPALTAQNPTNWVSDTFPDVYVFGAMTEVNAFIKDAQTSSLWDGRFKQSLQELHKDDAETRWSGTQLRIRSDF